MTQSNSESLIKRLKKNSTRPDIEHYRAPGVEEWESHYNRGNETRDWVLGDVAKNLMGRFPNKRQAQKAFDSEVKKIPKKDDYIILGENAGDPVFAHELGHAQKPGNILTKTMDKVDRKTGPYSKIIGPASVVGGSVLSAMGKKKLGAALPLVAAAPRLVEEARANINADRLMRKSTNDKDKIRNARKEFMGSYGSYLKPALKGSALTYLAGKTSDYLRNENAT